MSKSVIRKDLSVLGFCLFLYIVLVNVAAGGLTGVYFFVKLMSVYLSAGKITPADIESVYGIVDDAWGLLILNAASQYLIGMPVVAHIIKKNIPTIAVRLGLPSYYEAAPAVRQEAPLRFRDVPAILFIIVFLVQAGSLIGGGLAVLLGELFGFDAANTQVDALLSGNLAATIIFVVILAPLAEELFFRRLIVNSVKPLGKRLAVLVSATSFAFFHQNLFQFFYALFLGALFAVIYIKTERIWHTIALHMTVNLFGGVIMPYFTRDMSSELDVNGVINSGNRGEMVFVALYFAAALTGCVIFIVYLARGKFKVAEDMGTAPYSAARAAFWSAPGQIAFMSVCVAMAALTLSGALSL